MSHGHEWESTSQSVSKHVQQSLEFVWYIQRSNTTVPNPQSRRRRISSPSHHSTQPRLSQAHSVKVLGTRERKGIQVGSRLSAEGTAGLALGARGGVIRRRSVSGGRGSSVGGDRGGGGRSAGGSRGGRARGSRAGGAGAGSTTNDEVDAADVGLVDGAGVPPPLQGAAALGGAGGGQVGGDGNAEVLVAGLDAGGGGGVAVPADEGVADDAVGGQVDDGDVGDSGVGRGDVDDEGDLLAGGEALDGVGGGVVELVAAALPQVALGGVEVGLRGADLGHGLDVAVVVRRLHVPDLLTAGGLHGIAQGTGGGGGDPAVGRDAGGEESGSGDLLVHLD